LSHAGEIRKTSTASTAVTQSGTNNETHNTSTAFIATHYYHFFVKRQGLPANVLHKTATHTRYKATTCIRYNTDKYKNTKLSQKERAEAQCRTVCVWLFVKYW